MENIESLADRTVADHSQKEEGLIREAVNRYLDTKEWSESEEGPHLLGSQIDDNADPLQRSHVLYYDSIPLLEWRWHIPPVELWKERVPFSWSLHYTFLYPGKQPSCLTEEGNARVGTRFKEEGMVDCV